jgi:hypothetical protein
MRTVIAAFLFCLTSSIAYAQAFESSKPVLCDNVQSIIRGLTENYNEKPVWTARNPVDDTRYALFVNAKEGSWTLLQMTTEIACIIGVGQESKFLFDSV